MEKRKLSDLSLEKCIYMSVGPHVKDGSDENESFEEIIARKAKEIDPVNGCGWSLWADGKIPTVKFWELFDEEDEIYALMANTGEPLNSEGERAYYYCEIGSNEPKEIPEGIYVTYAGKPYALLVEEYYEIDDIFNKGDYNRYSYYNGFELLKKCTGFKKSNNIKICYAAKLKYPFYVKISKTKG